MKFYLTIIKCKSSNSSKIKKKTFRENLQGMRILRRPGSSSEMMSLYDCPIIVISPVDLITHVARLDQDHKVSLVFLLVDALLNKESQRQPEAIGVTAEEG